ncbi:hypothetical protein OEG84_14650 [Hoeflea sp. G2-23]|uniref:Uncharacterized protein n=1 Tax=Hoeflea algicola TaxID=2983763 RepID=A0ABT3ZB87_9HYPH|nr:hypothetical protein [Hoeflea algicola]MCY0148908.1 hypothetical protein [Hoeflea algicola]
MAAITAAVPAQAGSRSGGRLDAITTGRIYDRLLTPQLNPDYAFADPQAQRRFGADVREGRIKMPERPQHRSLFDFLRN